MLLQVYQFRQDPDYFTPNLNPVYDTNPAPALIKYGFNFLATNYAVPEVTQDPNHLTALRYDLTNHDTDNFAHAIVTKAALTAKFMPKLTFQVLTLWEIFWLFQLWQQKAISAADTSASTDIATVYEIYHKIYPDASSKPEISTKVKSSSASIHLIMPSPKVDIDENAYVLFLIEALTTIVELAASDSALILQVFGIQTAITVEILAVIASFYKTSYIYRPVAAYDLTTDKYFVALGFKSAASKPDASALKAITDKIKQENLNLTSVGITISAQIHQQIQRLNGYLIPEQYAQFMRIKKYLQSGIFTGAIYQELVTAQQDRAKNWAAIFMGGNPTKVLDQALALIEREQAKIQIITHD